MADLSSLVGAVSGFLWGTLLWPVILAVGCFLSFRLLWFPLRRIGFGFHCLLRGRKDDDTQQHLAPFSSLMLSLSATVGTGNIAGVATAIAVGGPGALFWMWLSAIFGLATKYSEAVCAVHFREKNAKGQYVGGPMYYIKNGLPKIFAPLAILFAVFGALAGFGIGNAVQANSIADALGNAFGINRYLIVVVVAVPVALVLLGGMQRIAQAVKALVPAMAAIYLVAGFIVIIANIAELPAALALIFKSAFTGTAAQGGFAGALMAQAIEKGISRGVFSNEAGLGSAPIAHASANTQSPVEQGSIAMLGTFIDTLIICSITGLAIVCTGVWTTGETGAGLSQLAFAQVLPWGDKVVAICLCIFAFTTILGWSFYGERCIEFLLGLKAVPIYRILWVLMIPLGILASLDLVWSMADVFNALMALPNLIALVLLSGVIVKLTKEYQTKKAASD